MIELYILNELAKFSESKTLTAVAEELFVSQPALTRSMKKLEDLLGVKLFDRRKNRITLNETGKIAAEYAKKVVEAEKVFEDKVKEYEKSHCCFSFASIAPMPIMKLNSFLSKALADYKIESTLSDSERELYKLLDDLEVDLIVTLKEPKNKNKYYFEKLFEEHLFVVLPKNHPLAKKKSILLKELSGEKILIYNKLGFWYNITKKLAPKAEFFDQTELSSVAKLSEFTNLVSFRTNFTLDDISNVENKKVIPIANPELNVQFYCVCRKRDVDKLGPIFSMIRAEFGG